MSKHSVAHLSNIDEITDGREPFRPVRHHLGVTSFGVNAWSGRNAGDRILNEHAEDQEGDPEELYFVHEGRARFEIDGEQVDAPAGTFVLVPPGPKRTAFAEEPGTTIVAIGATPGQAYEPVGWELWVPLNPLYRDGRYEEAADRGRELAAAHPEYPGLLYNVACCESLAGRKEDAIQHLRAAIEGSDTFRAYAAGDSDFDAIRDDPAFKELVGSEAS
jgi:tetratricopeptide (TPR) repeat protein